MKSLAKALKQMNVFQVKTGTKLQEQEDLFLGYDLNVIIGQCFLVNV